MRPESGPKTRWLAAVVRRAPHTTFVLATLILGVVLCFLFPEYLTTPGIRSHYPLTLIRQALFFGMWFTLALGFAALVFLPHKRVSTLALFVLLCAYLLGGSQAPLKEEYDSFVVRMGLDIFLLDLFVLGAIFIPLEALFPLRKSQPLIRPEFRTDLVYFAVSHLGFQAIALATNYPVERWLNLHAGGVLLAATPLWVQIPLGLIIADFCQYVVHRSFHTGVLWRFHAVHHSIKALDWLAGSRLHLVDIIVTRGAVFAALFVSVSSEALPIIVLILAFQTVWIHSNTRWGGGWLEYVFITPRLHHWHHADNAKSYDTNFAVQFSFIDRIFGTFHAPRNVWPDSYGVSDSPPNGYIDQFVWPFTKLAAGRGDSATGESISVPSSRFP
jgi:sterol desaturase/sphingolipid hydroxylase (fatty acid hydroxylase superfamily)